MDTQTPLADAVGTDIPEDPNRAAREANDHRFDAIDGLLDRAAGVISITSNDREALIANATITARKTARIVGIVSPGKAVILTDRGPVRVEPGDIIATNHPHDDDTSDVWPISRERYDATYAAVGVDDRAFDIREVGPQLLVRYAIEALRGPDGRGADRHGSGSSRQPRDLGARGCPPAPQRGRRPVTQHVVLKSQPTVLGHATIRFAPCVPYSVLTISPGEEVVGVVGAPDLGDDHLALSERTALALERTADAIARTADAIADLGPLASERNALHRESVDIGRQGIASAQRSELVAREVARSIDGGLDREREGFGDGYFKRRAALVGAAILDRLKADEDADAKTAPDVDDVDTDTVRREWLDRVVRPERVNEAVRRMSLQAARKVAEQRLRDEHLVREPTRQLFAVLRDPSTAPPGWVNQVKVTYDNRVDAIKAADSLSVKNGGRYFVLEAIGTAEARGWYRDGVPEASE